ncbi:ABC transporter substrate-binding protein [Beijerinckia sp. L45]|uniref:ABC transporter substrate-binding protein n=1 Tax=Beijerinckia sp. L45 TaxID=1641855 RepID=UPI00131E0699|nr:nitrate ABC transporter substrate-binding protein [Beijerinckia sp. L45]
MSDAKAKSVIRVSPNPPVFDLPIIVALEHGLFEKAGLDVRYSAKYADHDRVERDVLKRQKEALFDAGSADSFNVCEWGGVDRIERGLERGKIAALRPAIAAQAIVTFDAALQTPRDLANVAIGVNDFTGSHYTTVGLLEGAVGKENVVLEHIGAPEVRLQAAKEGRIRAVTVMEPFISLAVKQGAHIVALTFYRGAEVVSDDIPLADRETFFNVLDEAVDLINADFGRYAHHIAAASEGLLEANELDSRYVRYTHVQRYSADLFNPAYDWMKDRGFTVGANTHQTLVLS